MKNDYLDKSTCLNGSFWCASSPVIIVDNIGRPMIEQVIDELIVNGGFQYLFEYFGFVDERDILRLDFPKDFFDKGSTIEPSVVNYNSSKLIQMLTQLKIILGGLGLSPYNQCIQN